MLNFEIYKYVLKELHKYPILETAILLLHAYSSYLLAEGLKLSGIVAILFAGIVLAHYAYKNLSEEAKVKITCRLVNFFVESQYKDAGSV